MALIICIETATNICSVSLARDGQTIALRESDQGRDHARKAAVYARELLEANELEPADLDAVAVSKGPGSYTGLRIGVSLAKGLCYGLEIPLIGVGSLESLAKVAVLDHEAGVSGIENFEKAILCPMIDARRMEVYTQRFSASLGILSPAEALIITGDSFSDIAADVPVIIFGDGAAKCMDVLPEGRVVYADVAPSARGMAAAAQAAFDIGKFEDTAYFEPMYLKDFMVIPSKKKFF